MDNSGLASDKIIRPCDTDGGQGWHKHEAQSADTAKSPFCLQHDLTYGEDYGPETLAR
jgi:hypothetical protein